MEIGYIMYSAIKLQDRSINVASGYNEHLVPVYWDSGSSTWKADLGSGTPVAFTAQAGDVLVASVDFASPAGTAMLAGGSTTENGIQRGVLVQGIFTTGMMGSQTPRNGVKYRPSNGRNVNVASRD